MVSIVLAKAKFGPYNSVSVAIFPLHQSLPTIPHVPVSPMWTNSTRVQTNLTVKMTATTTDNDMTVTMIMSTLSPQPPWPTGSDKTNEDDRENGKKAWRGPESQCYVITRSCAPDYVKRWYHLFLLTAKQWSMSTERIPLQAPLLTHQATIFRP